MENIKNDLEIVMSETDEFKNLLKILKLKIVALHKQSSKKINSLEKKLQKKNKKRKNPSGFAKPSKISSELCSFMNKPPGTKVARTEVTRYLINYIKEHNLQDDANRRSICPDEKLSTLLDVKKNITFFSIQSFMNKHFIKYNDVCELTN
jgi:upstream activation factor subunit UAF30